MPGKVSAVITAGCPKPDMIERYQAKLGGKSLVSHSIDAFDSRDDVREVILVVSEPLRSWIEGDPLTFSSEKLKLVDRGGSPVASVAVGVAAASGDTLLLHSGNRPNLRQDLIDDVLATMKPGIAAVPGIPAGRAVAHITSISGDESQNGNAADDVFGAGSTKDRRVGHVMEFSDPDQLYLLQSPQAYVCSEVKQAFEKAGDALDDYPDASAVYVAAGFEVAVVLGHTGNLAATDDQVFNLLNKLMGGGTKKKKDRYGGLGW